MGKPFMLPWALGGKKWYKYWCVPCLSVGLEPAKLTQCGFGIFDGRLDLSYGPRWHTGCIWEGFWGMASPGLRKAPNGVKRALLLSVKSGSAFPSPLEPQNSSRCTWKSCSGPNPQISVFRGFGIWGKGFTVHTNGGSLLWCSKNWRILCQHSITNSVTVAVEQQKMFS